MYLNEEDRKYLNEVYARAYKKYFAYATDYADQLRPCLLSYEDALQLAEEQTERYNENMRAHINAAADSKIALTNANYEAKCTAINTESSKRGLVESTVVIYQLEKALADKQSKIESIENDRALKLAKFEITSGEKIEKAARKLYNDSLKNNISIAREASMSQNRSLKEAQNQKLLSTQAQKLLDEEMYAHFLLFLLKFAPNIALGYVDDDPIFNYNLSESYYLKLVAELEQRGWRA